MDIWESIQPIWKVFAVGLLLGAGLPALFALGVHYGAVHTGHDGEVIRASAAGKAISYICFAVVGIAILFGLAVLINADAVLPAVGLG